MNRELLDQRGTNATAPRPDTGISTVLVPTLNPSAAADLINLAGTMLSPYGDSGETAHEPRPEPRIVIMSVVEVPDDQPLTSGLVLARSYRALLDFLPSQVMVGDSPVRVDRVVKVSRDVASAINEGAASEGAHLIMLHWKGHARHADRDHYGRTIDSVLKGAPCDVALVRPDGLRASNRIVLPVRGGPSAERALSIAIGVAHGLGLPISIMHNVPVSQPADDRVSAVEAKGEEPYIVFNEHLKWAEEEASVQVERILTVGGDPVAALLGEMRPGDFVIMGAAPHSDRDKSEDKLSSVSRRVAEQKGPPVMLLHAYERLDLEDYRSRVNTRREHRSGDDLPFEHWFVENTFHADEFRDPEVFIEAKRRSGLTISVGLLTYNDDEHMHSILVGLKRVLQEMHPIADQLAIIDAGSTDNTVLTARSLGVDVYSNAQLLADRGNLHGRGECWWKSLSVLNGDVIVWLDPRAQRFHPSTAMSLAGPLLRVPTLQLVKSYGQPQRAHSQAKKTTPAGTTEYAPVDISWGGFTMQRDDDEHHGRIRVMSLRPEDLLSLNSTQIASLPPRTIVQILCPALAGVIEPFSRDIAGRRNAMLSVPAFTGASLDVGLLMSIASEYGTKGIAQVELRHSQPAPPPQPGLRGAIDLLQALARRLPDAEMRRLASETCERLQRSFEGEVSRAVPDAGSSLFEVRALGPVERPPMRSVAGQ